MAAAANAAATATATITAARNSLFNYRRGRLQ